MNMLMKSNMQGDPAEITRFLELLFKHCKLGEGYFALRAFRQEVANEDDNKPIHSEWKKFDKDLPQRAAEVATIVAHFMQADRAVFCPPVCLFKDNSTAKEANVLSAPAVSVELDSRPQEGLEALQAILGVPTCVVASGGVWQGQDKLHLHWRLTKPASGPDLPMLKKVRRLATDIVAADPTNVPVNHPLRWPGSWHTKGEPRFCRIVDDNPDAEINLYEAYVKLKAAADEMGLQEDVSEELDVEGFKTKEPWSGDALHAAAERIENPEHEIREHDWHHMNKVMMAFFDASHASEDGLAAFNEFSSKHSKHNLDYNDARWSHMKTSPPTRTSAGTLVRLARQTDPSFHKKLGDPALYIEGEPPKQSLSNKDAKPGEDKPIKLFNLTSFNDAAASALNEYAKPLIKGLLDQQAMTVLYGESNAGKTFVAMDMAYHIAKGVNWNDMRTAHFPVLYVAAEGGLGAKRRAAALAHKYGACDDFHFLMHPVNLLRADADLEPLIATIAATGLHFGLVVIDTLSRAMGGGDENAPTDMGVMVKHLDKVRLASQAHMLVVHHSGKDRAKGARGHSSLRAATDTEIEIANREILVTKQRDLDGSFARAFDLEVIELGKDGDGDPITSCTVRLLRRDEETVGVPTPRENDVLHALKTFLGASPVPELGASPNEIMAFIPYALSLENVRYYLRELHKKSITERINRGKWRLKAEEKRSSVTDPKRFIESEAEESGGNSEENVFE